MSGRDQAASGSEHATVGVGSMLACLLGAASQFRQVKSEIDAFDPIFVEVDLAPRKWWHIIVVVVRLSP